MLQFFMLNKNLANSRSGDLTTRLSVPVCKFRNIFLCYRSSKWCFEFFIVLLAYLVYPTFSTLLVTKTYACLGFWVIANLCIIRITDERQVVEKIFSFCPVF